MGTKTVSFENGEGATVHGRLELPPGGPPLKFAIFSHCFVCAENTRAATHISRQLTLEGFGVLHMDFTGLEENERPERKGTFTSTLSDIRGAARFLEAQYTAPSLMVGHSIGGTAILHLADELDSVKAIALIGAPADVTDVLALVKKRASEAVEGRREIHIGGKSFWIGEDFIRDLQGRDPGKSIERLNKALLLLHSPQDLMVPIENAATLYKSARHSKSFISLDGADHLLTNKEDTVYAAQVISAWAARYIPAGRPKIQTDSDIAVQLGTDRYTAEVVAGDHGFLADEPESMGGNGLGPSPYELLSAALGTCTAMTMRMYADRKEWPMDRVTVHVSHEKQHAVDSSHPEQKRSRIDVFTRKLDIEGNLDDDQIKRLVHIADRCPVHRTLTNSEIRIDTEVIE